MSRFSTLLLKEYWENQKTLLWMPVALTLAIWLLSALFISNGTVSIHISGNVQAPRLPVMPFLALPFFLCAGLAAITYCGNCFVEERRDRSIVFWRSLPVSDIETVAAKAATALVLLPVISYLAGLLAQLPVAILLTHLGNMTWPEVLATMAQQGEHFIWLSILMAPYSGAMMLLSVLTNRPLLWMLVGPIVIFIGESLLLNGHPVSQLLFGQMTKEILMVLGSLIGQPMLGQGANWVTSGALLSTTWSMISGLAMAAIFWGLCAEVRRRRLIKD
ncbi:hypothetical protein [Gallaecimonas mangrovi]|uniref:hypothetical protein n=1 Tax=Gallaecimonas mangrovi TaxID=2291597 RepID=UPI000E201840|nr:hypothetical protein [Gallaecimonas mangrovi]